MIAFLLDIYILIVWLVFFRFKLLVFDLKAKISTAVIGLIAVLGLLIAVNFLHPQTMDARLIAHVIEVSSRLPQAGRVVEVPVRPNVPVKSGDVLFRIDPRPFEYEVSRLKAVLAQVEQSVPQLQAAFEGTTAEADRVQAQLDLAQKDFERTQELRQRGASTDQELDEKRRNLEAALNAEKAALAAKEQSRLAIDIGQQKIAETKAQLSSAELNLEDTTVKAPTDGFVTNLELEPGFVVGPGQAVMSFVCDPKGIVGATFLQQYIQNIESGNEVELAFDMYPGKTLHGTVDNVIWATGAGQISPSGVLPSLTQTQPHGRMAVRLQINEDDLKNFPLAAGASGSAAVYTNHGAAFKIVRRVILRWYTWLNYIKLGM